MATAELQTSIAEHVQCVICLKQLTDPRVLETCQHTFCLECLNRLFQEAPDRKSLTCPSCSQETPVPDAGPPGLPKNRFVNQLVEWLKSCKEELDLKCDNCVEEGAAAGYCEDCDHLLCDDCIQTHYRFKKTKMHNIMTISVYKERCHSSSRSLMAAREPDCPVHHDQQTEVYCKTCKKAICYKCVAVQHQTCVREDLSNTCREKKTTIDSYTNRVEDCVLKPLQTAADDTKQLQLLVKQSAEETKRDIDEKIEACQQLLQQRRQQLHAEVDQHHGAWHKCLLQTLKHFEADIHNAVQVATAAKLITASKKKSHVISAAVDMTEQLELLCQKHGNVADHPLPTPQPLTFSVAIQTFQDVVNNLGTVNTNDLAIQHVQSVTLQNITSSFVVKNIPPTAPPVVRVQSPQDGPPAEVAVCEHDEACGRYQINLTTRALGKHKVYIQVSQHEMESIDKSFEVTSVVAPDKPKKVVSSYGQDYKFHYPKGVTMCDGHVLVADHDNCRLQEFDIDGQLIRSFQGTGKLAAAALHPTSVVLATDNTNHRVQVFSRDGRTLHSFGRKGSQPGQFVNPHGIGVTSDGNMVVADRNNGRLQVISIMGTSIRQFSTCSQGRKLNRPYFLTVDPTNDNILVADRNGHTVEEFTKDGQHVRSIGQGSGKKANEMYCPTGVSLHPSNILLVADYGNNRVSFFTRGGECVKQLDGIQDPYDVTCSNDGQLFVSQCDIHKIQFY